MSKFKIGDRVRLIEKCDGLTIGDEGIVTESDTKPWVHFEGKHGLVSGAAHCADSCRAVDESKLELVEKPLGAGIWQLYENLNNLTINTSDFSHGQYDSPIYLNMPQLNNKKAPNEASNNKENKKMNNNTPKMYRLLQDVPYFTAGAIFKYDDAEYIPIEDYWYTDAANKSLETGIGTPCMTKCEVEYSPEFFERIYEISKLGKMVYVTKEAAIKEASKFFKAK